MFSFGKKKGEKVKAKMTSQSPSPVVMNKSESDTYLSTVHSRTTTYQVERTERTISTYSDSTVFERTQTGSGSSTARSSLRSIPNFHSPLQDFDLARSNLPSNKIMTDAKVYQSPYMKTSSSQYVPRPSLPSANWSSMSSNIATNNVGTTSSSLEPKLKKTNEKSTNGVPVKIPKVVVIKTNERYDGNQHIPTYLTHSKKRGRALIINNMKFVEEKDYRHGAELDEQNISELFKQMGFDITRERDVKKDKLLRTAKSFADTSAWKNVDICVVVIMSHGTKHNGFTQIMCSDEKVISTDDIVDLFTLEKCKYLKDKPKIFIFQCCRGSAKDQIQTDAKPFKETPSRNCADMLIAHSTVPGYVSHRDPETGSWYIQTVCEVFSQEAHHFDVESMLKIVDSKLAQFQSLSKQTSSYESRGFKRCYFHP